MSEEEFVKEAQRRTDELKREYADRLDDPRFVDAISRGLIEGFVVYHRSPQPPNSPDADKEQ